jgi:hypothetical protein
MFMVLFSVRLPCRSAISLKTARAPGLDAPPSLLALARLERALSGLGSSSHWHLPKAGVYSHGIRARCAWRSR